MDCSEDGKRLIEMEKYKLDLVELRDSIHNKLTNTLDYNKLRPAVVLPEHFYSPSIARELYLLMQETSQQLTSISSLRQPRMLSRLLSLTCGSGSIMRLVI